MVDGYSVWSYGPNFTEYTGTVRSRVLAFALPVRTDAGRMHVGSGPKSRVACVSKSPKYLKYLPTE